MSPICMYLLNCFAGPRPGGPSTAEPHRAPARPDPRAARPYLGGVTSHPTPYRRGAGTKSTWTQNDSVPRTLVTTALNAWLERPVSTGCCGLLRTLQLAFARPRCVSNSLILDFGQAAERRAPPGRLQERLPGRCNPRPTVAHHGGGACEACIAVTRGGGTGNVGGQADAVGDVLLVGGEVLADGELEGPAVWQRVDALNHALAIRLMAQTRARARKPSMESMLMVDGGWGGEA